MISLLYFLFPATISNMLLINMINTRKRCRHPVRNTMVQIQITKAMNGSLMFLAMLALGALCYWFYYKCVDWFEKI